MQEIAQEVIKYFEQNILLALVIAVVAGFAGVKSVSFAKKGNPALYLIVGVLGAFVGQFAILYFGLDAIFEEVAAFRPFFDLLAAYIGAFILASIINFIKPH